MLHLHKRIIAVLAACLTWGSMTIPVGAANVAASPAVGRDVTATLTAKHGTVFKRTFRGTNREEYGEPESAEIQDQLREGMQIGTGNESWAEVTWPNVKTRAWSNTVFAVAPNKRLVYLTGGEMLFRLDKHRKDKEDYYIWTKVLQARIRGTTVLVQAKGPVTRFTVMEGTVELKNRLDNSRVTLRPGVVYEIKGYNLSNPAPMPNIGGGAPAAAPTSGQTDTYRPTPMVAPKSFDGSINEITYDAKNYLPLFQDKFATTNLYAANSDALRNHPLIKAGETIDSLPLIEEQQRELPGYSKFLPIKMADTARLNKVIYMGVDVAAVPSKAAYFVGQSVGKDIKLPPAAYGYLPPDGTVLNPASAATPRPTAVIASPTIGPAIPLVIPGLVLPVPEETTAHEQNAAKVFEEELAPLPTVPYSAPSTGKADALQSTQVPSLVPTTCLTPGNTGASTPTSAFQPMPGALAPNPVPSINGVLSPGTFSGAFTGTAMPTSAAPTSGAGAVGGGQALAPVFNLQNNLNNTLNNTLNLGY